MRNSLLIFLLLISNFTYAQMLQGKIVDEISGEPIPFVSIGVIGANTTTVTNDAGEFVFKNISLPAKFRYSHVSYLPLEQEELTATSSLVIKLKPAAINLKPVVIDPNKGSNLLKAALEKATSFENKTFYGNAFYRQLTSVNGQASQIYELFYDLAFNVSQVKGWVAKQSRFAESNQSIAFSMSNQSYLTFSLAGSLLAEKKSGKLVSLKTLKDFYISIDKFIEQKDQDIAVISCKFKGGKKQFYVNSTYYVGVNDMKIYRIENSLFNLPINTGGATTKIPPIATTVATFNGADTPIPVIENISTKLYLNLNAGGRTLTSVISSMLTVFKLDNNLNKQKFNEINKNVKDKAVVESVVYNPEFWKNNPVVKQTALEDNFIKMMENKSAFGTMINPL